MSYDYTNRTVIIEKTLETMFDQDNDKLDGMTPVLLSSLETNDVSSNKQYYSWLSKIHINVEEETISTNKFNKSKLLRMLIREIHSALDEPVEDIFIESNGISLIFFTPYIKDITNIFNYTILFNTILKFISSLMQKNQQPLFNYNIGMHTYVTNLTFISKSKTRKLYIPYNINDPDIARLIADDAHIKNLGKIAISGKSYNYIKDSIIKTDEKFNSWIIKSYKEIGGVEYYYCNIIKSKFNNYIEKIQ
ncbi:MAG: hypothetical protein C4537_05410 [Acholeplasma sp.]|jgi:hypothetical protein|nr:MAG: hypothetical protein C4537_05410 [Acholeplasma sp.]